MWLRSSPTSLKTTATSDRQSLSLHAVSRRKAIEFRFLCLSVRANRSIFPQKTAPEPQRNRVPNDSGSARLSAEASTMTTPAIAIKNEIRELIHLQIEMFGQPHSQTSSELIDCSYRAERIKQLVKSLIVLAEPRFSKRGSGRRLKLAD